MSLANLNFTSLATNATVPTTGNNYTLLNAGFNHCLDNAGQVLSDANPVLGWSCKDTDTTNQIWSYLSYPTSNGGTIFTLQVISTLESESDAVIDGRGGYMRVDPETNGIVHGGQPQAWKLVEIGTSVYKISPFESAFNPNGTLYVTDVSFDISDPNTNQLLLQENSSDPQQLWTFHEP